MSEFYPRSAGPCLGRVPPAPEPDVSTLWLPVAKPAEPVTPTETTEPMSEAAESVAATEPRLIKRLSRCNWTAHRTFEGRRTDRRPGNQHGHRGDGNHDWGRCRPGDGRRDRCAQR